MEMIRKILNLISRNWKKIVEFELFYKLISLCIFTPLFAWMFNLTIKVTGYRYLTAENISLYLAHPLTFFLLLILAFGLAFYSLFDISAIIYIFDQSHQDHNVGLTGIIRFALYSSKNVFHRKNFLIVFFVLFMLPFLHIGIASSYISTLTLPEFILTYIYDHWYFLLLLLAGLLLIGIFVLRWIYSLHYFVLEQCDFKECRTRSHHLIHTHFVMDLSIFILMEIIYSLLFLAFSALGIMVISFIFKHILSAKLAYSILLSIILAFIAFLIMVFSSLTTPACYACISTLFYDHKEKIAEPIHASKTYMIHHDPGHRRRIKTIELLLVTGCLFLVSVYMNGKSMGKFNFNIEYTKTMEVSAHRGASIHYPENTMSAFQGAVDEEADWIELDVQQTKDGQIIVMHDTNLSRTTGLNENIWNVTYDDIKDLDNGSWFSKKYSNERIPLLKDVLAFADDNHIRLNIELKPTGHEKDFEKNVIDLIREADFADNCVLTSQNYECLENAKAYDPDIETVYVMSLAYGKITDLDAADAFSVESSFVNQSLIHNVHNAGKELYVWTVNNKSSINKMIKLNVDNIITDNVTLAKTCVYNSKANNIILEAIRYMIR